MGPIFVKPMWRLWVQAPEGTTASALEYIDATIEKERAALEAAAPGAARYLRRRLHAGERAGPGQCIGDGECKGNTADGKLSARTRSIAKAKRPHFWSGIVSTVS